MLWYMVALLKGGDEALQIMEDIMDVFPTARAEYVSRTRNSLPGGRKELIDTLGNISDNAHAMHLLCTAEHDNIEWSHRAVRLGCDWAAMFFFPTRT